MKRIILTLFLFSLLSYCFGQKNNKEQSKEVPLYVLHYDKEDPVTNWLEATASTSGQSNTKVTSDGMLINSTKHFMQIKQPDVSHLARMPQVPIDTSVHYHIQIISEVKEQRTKRDD